MHSISRVKRASLNTALATIEQLVNVRFLPDLDAPLDNEQVKTWLEKTVVTYTSFCTVPSDLPKSDTIQRLYSLFDHITERTAVCLAPKATHAMQALIWKSLNDAQDEEAELWLGVLQHSLFTSVGASNKARIARKLMMTAIEKDELNTARTAFYGLSHSSQNEGMTRYLAYKLALRSNDLRLASECLASLAKHIDKEPRHMYACVLEAQQSGNRAMAVAAFQALIDHPSEGVQLPALLRCTVRLLMEELEISSTTQIEAMDQIVHLFETASANTKILRQGSEDQLRAEIQWWSKNSFNLALRHCAAMPPTQLTLLVRACNKFLRCYPDDNGLMHREELVDRMQVCHFICASAFTLLGRTTNDRPQQLQNYLEVQREVQAFLVIWQQPDDKVADAELRRARALELLRLNVESVFKLEQWDRLDEALAACLELQGATRWDTLADLVMVIYDQTSSLAIDSSATAKIPELLQKIINETWKKDKDMVKLARWLRFTISIGLEDAEGSMGIKLVEQAASLARRGTEGKNDPYPEDELQWLATTAFNKAVDLLGAGDRPAADQWIEAALELARYAADNGSLHAQLTKTREEAERRMRRRH